jgi:hypothetical protein
MTATMPGLWRYRLICVIQDVDLVVLVLPS